MGGASRVPSLRSASMRRASPATVGASKSAFSGTSTPKATRTREITCVASRLCPPSPKKFSSTPTRSTPSTSAQIPARSSSPTERGAAYASSVVLSGAGSARRSILPLAVTGSCSSTTYAPGTMYSGTCSATCARSCPAASSAPASGTTYATSRCCPGASSRSSTTASLTCGWPRRVASISPSSTR